VPAARPGAPPRRRGPPTLAALTGSDVLRRQLPLLPPYHGLPPRVRHLPHDHAGRLPHDRCGQDRTLPTATRTADSRDRRAWPAHAGLRRDCAGRPRRSAAVASGPAVPPARPVPGRRAGLRLDGSAPDAAVELSGRRLRAAPFPTATLSTQPARGCPSGMAAGRGIPAANDRGRGRLCHGPTGSIG